MSSATLLYDEVRGMSIDNFIVRPKRRAVERFAVIDLVVLKVGDLPV